MNQPLLVAYSDTYQNWQIGAGNGTQPTNPIRAKLAKELLAEQLGENCQEVDAAPEATVEGDLQALLATHEAAYVAETLAGDSGEWLGTKPEVAAAGFDMFRGTIRLVEKVLAGEAKVAFNPQGAKHHAQYDHGSGFCVFNDMAYAAVELQKAGLKPLYLDWDIHAGDGVYLMLKGKGIPTISIHRSGIYPGTKEMVLGRGERGEFHNPDLHGYNFNVTEDDGDEVFKTYIDGAALIIDQYQPDVILLAAGADGHIGQGNLGELAKYTSDGFRYAAEMVADKALAYSNGRVIIGGAGGYQPLKETPETWALVVSTIYNKINEGN